MGLLTVVSIMGRTSLYIELPLPHVASMLGCIINSDVLALSYTSPYLVATIDDDASVIVQLKPISSVSVSLDSGNRMLVIRLHRPHGIEARSVGSENTKILRLLLLQLAMTMNRSNCQTHVR